MLLGAIADDFTGATDLCSMLVRGGMRTVQLIGVPRDTDAPPDADAVVVALKSRTAPVRDAVQQSLAALAWLRRAGCRQFFFKYCSTFDSTDEGNIGPVADALIRELGCGFALACPAFPTNARTVYQGHLFVGGTLLNESGMEHHPLTPMTDANLVRVLGRQTDGTVGLVPYATVEQGAAAIRDAMTALKEQGRRYAIVDAVNDAHLLAIGEAASEHALITGGSGVAMRTAGEFPPRGIAAGAKRCRRAAARRRPRRGARRFVLARHADAAWHRALARAGVATRSAGHAGCRAACARRRSSGRAAGSAHTPIVIAASAPPDKVAALQAKLGRDAAGALIEAALAQIAEGSSRAACGASSWRAARRRARWCSGSACSSLRIGAEIDPGVPWTYAEGSGDAAAAGAEVAAISARPTSS